MELLTLFLAALVHLDVAMVSLSKALSEIGESWKCLQNCPSAASGSAKKDVKIPLVVVITLRYVAMAISLKSKTAYSARMMKSVT